ncbi:hypothetical protein ABIF53_000253 [Bradyrhizobium japonicum]
MKDNNDMPGHLARRFQQIAVAVFLAEVGDAGFDLTPVQYAALATIKANPGLDQVTLAGLIAYDRTTITGVIDRLVQKGLAERRASTPRPPRPRARGHRRRPAHAAQDHACGRVRTAHHAARPQRQGRRGADASDAQGDRCRQRAQPRPAPRCAGLSRIHARNCRSAAKPGTNLRLLPSAPFGA